MAIGKISGVMLQTDLARQGVNLSLDGNLVYFDVVNRRVGVNNNSPAYSFDSPGNVRLANLTITNNKITSNTGKIDFGTISNLRLAGGNPSDILYTDGAGNLAFGSLSVIAGLEGFTGNNILLGTTTQSGDGFGTSAITTGMDVSTAIGTLDNVLGNITNIYGNVITTANLRLTGGAANYVLITDGNGNTSWANLSALESTIGTTGMSIILGTPTDGSLTNNAAIETWTSTTYVTDAIDNLNQTAFNIAQNTFVGNVRFTATPLAGPSPMTVTFTGTSIGNPNSHYWDFGDGTTSTSGSTVSHTYANTSGGTFTVTYRASNSNGTNGGNASLGAVGSVDSYTRPTYITLYTPTPIPSFTTNVASLNSGNTILFTDTSQYETGYTVYWGDGTTTVSTSPGTTQKHTYTNGTTDTTYSIILKSNSTTAGASLVSVNSAPYTEKVYSVISPAITAPGSVSTYRTVNWEANGGGTVGITNGTTPTPGSASTFGAQQVYQYWWGDGTANSNVAIGSASSGDTSTTLSHTYALTAAQQIAGTSVTYNTQLKTYTGYSTSPFSSSNVQIIVEPSVRANLAAAATTLSNGSADNALTGYVYVDYQGNDRSVFTYTSNTTQNATNVNWNYGDGVTTGNLTTGTAGFPLAGNLTHNYSSTGTKTVSLSAYGQPDTIAQVNTKTLSINIKTTPTAPGALSSKTLSMSTGSVGTGPLLAANAVDNTAGNIASAGTGVTRYLTSTGTVVTNTITNANTSIAGTLVAYINRANAGGIAFSTLTNTTGTYTSLVIAADQDYHSVDATYPSYFYKTFNTYVNNPLTAANLGYNDVHLTHSTTGSTNLTSYVVDNVTSAPTLVTTGVTMSNVSATAIRTISGIPYYQTSGNIVIQGLQAYNWIGQTYTSSTPLSISANATLAEGTSGTIVSTQTKTYSQLDGATTFLSGGIPKANTGNVISNSYTFGNIYLTIDGTAAAVGNVSTTLTSVNGTSTAVSLPALINVYSSALSGLDENNILCSAGAAAGNTTVAKRIVLTGANVTTPTYANTGTNYYSGAAWSTTSTVAGTTEAIVRWGNLKVNTTDYSFYLPPGPNLAVGGNRTTTQSFKFAFQRPIMQNMKVIFTGKISGMYVAAPGTKLTDTSSTLNGWMDANVAYAGSGFPGQGTGGNGSTGCAVGTTVPLNTFVSNVGYVLTLGSSDLSTSSIHQCLFNIVLGPNDYVTNIYIGSYQ
jgi:PKD repeat protein